MKLSTTSQMVLVLCVGLVLTKVGHGQEKLSFEKDIRPIFKAYCLDCHGGEERLRGQLDLRLRHLIVKGGRKGAAIVPGQPAKSLLLERIQSGDMPPGEKKMPADQVAILAKWIEQGAFVASKEPDSLPPGIGITAEERAYWFYQPLVRPNVPQLANTQPIRTVIDAFILEKLQAKGLKFNPEADRETLIRRATFDLIGLPPTKAEIDAFVADNSPDAYERLIDRLLASPHYGERWGRHWLDLAGYADSDGDGTNDTVRPYAWKYRDYVIRAINNDKPLDRFIIEQMAGDELVPRPWQNLSKENIEILSATGFLLMAPDSTSSSNTIENREQAITDTIKIVGPALTGLTIGCAQCHDHRYDPIPQADYYRFRAVFEPGLHPANWKTPGQRRLSLYTDADRAKAAEVEKAAAVMQQDLNKKRAEYIRAAFEAEILKFPEDMRGKLKTAFDTAADKRNAEQKQLVAANPKLSITAGVLYQYNQKAADELKKLSDQINAKRAEKPAEDFVTVFTEVPGSVPVTKVFHRGDHRQPLQEVMPGDLTIASTNASATTFAKNADKLPTTGRRLAYAKHLTSGTHPLFGRVMANRIWLHHFGRGIVDTPGDFGILGVRPTHKELLDWLACELPARQWSLKSLHKLIMTSTVYRQASTRSAQQDAVDSDNALYGRYPMRRLEAEILRDRLLATTGKLDRQQFGPALAVTEDTVGQVIANSNRRSIYLQVRRTKPVAFLATFDAPTDSLHCPKRSESTAAPQALMLMNSDFILEQAKTLAERLQKETPTDFSTSALQNVVAKVTPAADAWRYGYGSVDEKGQVLKEFLEMPYRQGTTWQGGPALPDPKIGWVMLHAHGGHTGNDANHAAVRRYIVPSDGELAITGTLGHGSPQGDGVHGRILASNKGQWGEWTVHNKQCPTTIGKQAVKKGDAIDFVVDCRGECTCDSFTWPVKLTLTTATGGKIVADSVADYRAPNQASLLQQVAHAWHLVYQRAASAEELHLAQEFLSQQVDLLKSRGTANAETVALTNLCQQLLSSNEFLYVE